MLTLRGPIITLCRHGPPALRWPLRAPAALTGRRRRTRESLSEYRRDGWSRHASKPVCTTGAGGRDHPDPAHRSSRRSRPTTSRLCGGDVYARGHIGTIAAHRRARPDAAARRVRRGAPAPPATARRRLRSTPRPTRAPSGAARTGSAADGAVGARPRGRSRCLAARSVSLTQPRQPTTRRRCRSVTRPPAPSTPVDPVAVRRRRRPSRRNSDVAEVPAARGCRRDGRGVAAARSWISVTAGSKQRLPRASSTDGRRQDFTRRPAGQARHRQRRRRAPRRSTAATSAPRRQRPGRPAHVRAGRPHRAPADPLALARRRRRLPAMTARAAPAAHRRARHPRLRPQRGRLRGARRPAGGRRLELVEDPADADVVVVNTCGFVESAKKDSIDTLLAAADLGRRPAAGGRRRRLPGRAVRRPSWPSRCPRPTPCSASTTTPTIGDRLADPRGGTPHVPHAPRDRRLLLPLTPVDRAAPGRRRWRCPGTATRPARRRRPRPAARARAPASARRRPGGAAQARLRLRPALHASARSRRSAARSSPGRPTTCSPRRAGSPSRASASSCWSARTPRRTARTSATCGCSRRCCPSWPRSTASSGCGCPTCSRPRPAPGLVEAHRDHAGRRALLRPVLPARRRAGAAADAPLRRHGLVPRPARPGARAVARGRRPSQRHRRLPRRDRGRRRRAERLPDPRPGSTRSACSATPTRTAPRRRPTTDKLPPDEVVRARVERVSPAGRGADRAARRGPDRRAWSRVLVEEVDGDHGRGPGRAPGPGGRRQHDAARRPSDARVGDLVARVVVGVGRRRPGGRGRAVAAGEAAARRPDRHPGRASPRPGTCQRADRAAAAARPGLRLAAPARRRRRLRAGASPRSSCSSSPRSPTSSTASSPASAGWSPTFGKIADPIADKALTGTALVGLSLLGELPWWVTIVILVREIGVTLLRFWVIRHGVIAASRGGKVKTALQAVAVSLYLLPLTGFLATVRALGHGRRAGRHRGHRCDYVVKAVRLRRTSDAPWPSAPRRGAGVVRRPVDAPESTRTPLAGRPGRRRAHRARRDGRRGRVADRRAARERARRRPRRVRRAPRRGGRLRDRPEGVPARRRRGPARPGGRGAPRRRGCRWPRASASGWRRPTGSRPPASPARTRRTGCRRARSSWRVRRAARGARGRARALAGDRAADPRATACGATRWSRSSCLRRLAPASATAATEAGNTRARAALTRPDG